MASTSRQDGPAPERSYFEVQREALVGEIAVSLEQVLQNINSLNRSLESVIAVGNEFSSVEALWSQFENAMGKAPAEEAETKDAEQADDEEKQSSQKPGDKA